MKKKYLCTEATVLKWKFKVVNHIECNEDIRFKLPNLPFELISLRLETFKVIIGKLECPLAKVEISGNTIPSTERLF